MTLKASCYHREPRKPRIRTGMQHLRHVTHVTKRGAIVKVTRRPSMPSVAIGSIPRDLIANEEITEEMCALLAPVRPFAYIFAYTAGAHKAIRGHFSFFEVDLTHVGRTMNHFLKTGANPLVYVMLCGRMTPEQKEIVKKRARLDIQKMKDLLEWFINKSGHPGYEGVTPPSECPQPNIIADNDTTNNTDQRYPHRK